MAAGKKILDGVAKALDADAQRMPRFAAALLNGVLMESLRGLQALERHGLGDSSIGTHRGGMLAQEGRASFPFPQVEPCESGGGGGFAALFLLGEDGEELAGQLVARGVGIGSERSHPLDHDLRIAQLAETAKELAAGLLYRAPVGNGDDFGDDAGHGAAATQGYAQVVDGVGGEIRADAVGLFRGAVHPVEQAGAVAVRLLRNKYGGCHGGGHPEARGNVFYSGWMLGAERRCGGLWKRAEVGGQRLDVGQAPLPPGMFFVSVGCKGLSCAFWRKCRI